MSNEKRLIDANALLERAKFWLHIEIDDVKNAPTVDAVEVVHGRWEDEYGGEFANPRYRCSVCKGKSLYRFDRDCLGGWHDVQALTNYCPHCGAKMMPQPPKGE